MTGRETTLSDLLDQWLDLCRDEITPTMLREYRRLIAKRIVPRTRTRLDRETDHARPRQFLQGPDPRRVALAVVGAPAVNASPPRLRRDEITPPSLDELRLLLAAADRYDASFGVF